MTYKRNDATQGESYEGSNNSTNEHRDKPMTQGIVSPRRVVSNGALEKEFLRAADMHSTVQQRAYTVPTLRQSLHHSQVPFDAENSFLVKPVSPPQSRHSANRNCWTAVASSKTCRQHNSSQRKAPLVIEAAPGFRRSYTSLSPPGYDSSELKPSTAVLPRTGQVKLTALSEERVAAGRTTRARTTGAAKRRQTQLGRIPYQNCGGYSIPDESDINSLTLGDLQTALNTEFPVSVKKKTRGKSAAADTADAAITEETATNNTS